MPNLTPDQLAPDEHAEVRDLERAAAESDEQIRTLEQRVENGDESITPEDIEAVERKGRFARLKVRGAAARARRASEAQRDRLTAQIAADAEKLNTADLTSLQKHYAAAVKALAALKADLDAHAEARRQLESRARAVGAPVSTTRIAGVSTIDLAATDYIGRAVAEGVDGQLRGDRVFASSSDPRRDTHRLHTPARAKEIVEAAQARRGMLASHE